MSPLLKIGFAVPPGWRVAAAVAPPNPERVSGGTRVRLWRGEALEGGVAAVLGGKPDQQASKKPAAREAGGLSASARNKGADG